MNYILQNLLKQQQTSDQNSGLIVTWFKIYTNDSLKFVFVYYEGSTIEMLFWQHEIKQGINTGENI